MKWSDVKKNQSTTIEAVDGVSATIPLMERTRYSIVRHSLDPQSVELLDELLARFRRLDVERLPKTRSGRWCVYVTAGPDITDKPLRIAAIGDTLPDAASRMILMCQGVEDDG